MVQTLASIGLSHTGVEGAIGNEALHNEMLRVEAVQKVLKGFQTVISARLSGEDAQAIEQAISAKVAALQSDSDRYKFQTAS